MTLNKISKSLVLVGCLLLPFTGFAAVNATSSLSGNIQLAKATTSYCTVHKERRFYCNRKPVCRWHHSFWHGPVYRCYHPTSCYYEPVYVKHCWWR